MNFNLTDSQFAMIISFATAILSVASSMWSNWQTYQISKKKLLQDMEIAKLNARMTAYNACYEDHLNSYKNFLNVVLKMNHDSIERHYYIEYMSAKNILYGYSSENTRAILDKIKISDKALNTENNETFYLLSESVAKDLENRRKL